MTPRQIARDLSVTLGISRAICAEACYTTVDLVGYRYRLHVCSAYAPYAAFPLILPPALLAMSPFFWRRPGQQTLARVSIDCRAMSSTP